MSKLRIAVLLGLALALIAVTGLSEQKPAEKTIPDFELHGIDFTECACTAYACPCRSNGHPTHGGCDAADFAYFQHGHFGKVKMDGFKAVVVGDLIDKDMSKVKGHRLLRRERYARAAGGVQADAGLHVRLESA